MMLLTRCRGMFARVNNPLAAAAVAAVGAVAVAIVVAAGVG